MPDKISKKEREAIDQFLNEAKKQGRDLVVPVGKSGLTLEQVISPGKKSPGFEKRSALGRHIRARIKGYLEEGLNASQIAEKMYMSKENVMYHMRKLPPR